MIPEHISVHLSPDMKKEVKRILSDNVLSVVALNELFSNCMSLDTPKVFVLLLLTAPNHSVALDDTFANKFDGAQAQGLISVPKPKTLGTTMSKFRKWIKKSQHWQDVTIYSYTINNVTTYQLTLHKSEK